MKVVLLAPDKRENKKRCKIKSLFLTIQNNTQERSNKTQTSPT
jgi:hypothetical protein